MEKIQSNNRQNKKSKNNNIPRLSTKSNIENLFKNLNVTIEERNYRNTSLCYCCNPDTCDGEDCKSII